MKVKDLCVYLNSLVASDARWNEAPVDVLRGVDVLKIKRLSIEARTSENLVTSVFLTVEE